MMLWAIALIEAELAPKHPGDDGVEIAIMTHDSVAGCVPETDAAHYVAEICAIMSSLPLHELGWQPQLDFPADGELGPSLAKLTKLKVAG